MEQQQPIKTGDEIVFMCAIIKRDQWEGVKLPPGCFAKAYEVGKIEELTDVRVSRGWGAMAGTLINRLAKKLCPEAALFLGPQDADQPL